MYHFPKGKVLSSPYSREENFEFDSDCSLLLLPAVTKKCGHCMYVIQRREHFTIWDYCKINVMRFHCIAFTFQWLTLYLNPICGQQLHRTRCTSSDFKHHFKLLIIREKEREDKGRRPTIKSGEDQGTKIRPNIMAVRTGHL